MRQIKYLIGYLFHYDYSMLSCVTSNLGLIQYTPRKLIHSIIGRAFISNAVSMHATQTVSHISISHLWNELRWIFFLFHWANIDSILSCKIVFNLSTTSDQSSKKGQYISSLSFSRSSTFFFLPTKAKKSIPKMYTLNKFSRQ